MCNIDLVSRQITIFLLKRDYKANTPCSDYLELYVLAAYRLCFEWCAFVLVLHKYVCIFTMFSFVYFCQQFFFHFSAIRKFKSKQGLCIG